ncbi:MAG: hypothetical protein ACYDH5_03260 [Acidimicrobiales bacterium]
MPLVEDRVLVALSCAPLGLSSIRAVARAASVSPTSASRALGVLGRRGWVSNEVKTLPGARAHDVTLWRVDFGHPEWPSMLERIAAARPFTRRVVPLPPGTQDALPSRFAHLFWNAPVGELSVSKHSDYIAHRALVADDPGLLTWAIAALPPRAWETAARIRGTDAEHRSLAVNLASVTAEP